MEVLPKLDEPLGRMSASYFLFKPKFWGRFVVFHPVPFRHFVCIGNSIISSAITDKQARVSFKKLQNSASPKDERYLRFLKTHECLFSVIAREIILLLINNIKRKCSNKHFVLTTSHYASALILEFLRLKKSCLQKPWLKVLCTKFQHTLEFVL